MKICLLIIPRENYSASGSESFVKTEKITLLKLPGFSQSRLRDLTFLTENQRVEFERYIHLPHREGLMKD